MSAAAAASLKAAGDSWPIYRRLLKYAKPYVGVFLIGVLGSALFAASNVALAYLVQKFLHGAFIVKNPAIVWEIPIGVVVLFTLRGIGDYVQSYYPSWVGRQVIKGLRRDVFSHYLRLPTAYLDRQQSGHLLSKLTNNIELVATAATGAAISLISDSLTILALLARLFYLNWRLALFCIVAAPVIGWLMRIANRSFRRYSERIQSSMGDITRVAKEAIEAHRLIKIFNAEDHQTERFEQVNEHNRVSNMKLIRARAISNPVVQCIASIALGSVLYVAIHQVFSQHLEVDEFFGFLTALMLIPAPLRSLVNMSGPLQQGIAAGQSVFEILDHPTEGSGGSIELVRARGDIEFRNVSFSYGGEKGEVLRDVSFRVRPGETVAIVGPSGSGKTTLVGLVPRFYDAQQGEVLLDGVDVRDYRLTDLRSQVSLVSQDVVLFNDTIRNNIAFNAVDKTDAEVEAAARAANVMEFVAQQPRGFDTPLTDRGQNFSGGQRQRISIARALLKDSPVLILDEATAALDNESERRVQQELAALMQGRTTLVIAHRLSTVEGADRIIVLEQGRIVESGTHRELLVRGGLYATLHGTLVNASELTRNTQTGSRPPPKMSVQSWFNRIWYDRAAPPWWLLPLSALYGAAAASRRYLYSKRLRKSIRAPVPVVVVGNLSVGGTGKTPLVCWLVSHLAERGFRPGVVIRGYGGASGDARIIDASADPDAVGDEPVLLVRRTGVPVAVGRDRPAAAQLLVNAGCDVVVSDDGLQHYALARDCEIVVIDGERLFGNGSLLPAGPLREPKGRLAAADAVVLNGGRTPLDGAFSMRLEAGSASSVTGAAVKALGEFAGLNVHAVAGIGNPQRFFDMLRAHGIEVMPHPLPDHARLRAADISFGDQCPVLMTEKDAVKCAGIAGPRHWYVPVTAAFGSGESKMLLDIVTRAMSMRAARA